ncbi:hypothetical protein V5O48_012822 [Marasmius crinis-equi]|uniref:Uncharacterized protein n=1 Tax=Marasmius crinis-equi TaxID=585013 RepID=A0ABR3F1T7_9AGAR
MTCGELQSLHHFPPFGPPCDHVHVHEVQDLTETEIGIGIEVTTAAEVVAGTDTHTGTTGRLGEKGKGKEIGKGREEGKEAAVGVKARKDDGRRKDKHKHKRKRSRSRSLSSDSEDERRRRKKEKKEKKERKREKREKKKSKASGSGSGAHWGKYGIISEIDIFNKSPEFHTWLVEERKINPETISREQNKKEFARFVEDYNTATLPHEKYYNMETYEKRMAALRAGEMVPASAEDTYDADADMRALKSQHKKPSKKDDDSYLSREQLMELRQVQNERIQAGKMKLLGMDIKQNMGVRMDGSSFDD